MLTSEPVGRSVLYNVVVSILGEEVSGWRRGSFRLPGSSYEELVNIIVAYGTRDESAGTGDVGRLDSVHQSSVSRNNAFLAEIGVLQGEDKKQITRRGRTLAVALARKDRTEIRSNWRAIVSASEFLQNVVSAVKLREGMLYPTVQAYIAHAAGQPRNKPVMNGAGAIVEILKAAGLLREEAGELVATFDEQPERPPRDGLPQSAGRGGGRGLCDRGRSRGYTGGDASFGQHPRPGEVHGR